MDCSELIVLSRSWIEETKEQLNEEESELQEDGAIFALLDYVFDDQLTAWIIIKSIVAGCDDEVVLARLSAGPFESLLFQIKLPYSEFFGPDDVSSLELLLPGTWLQSLPAEKAKELQEICSGL